MLLSVKACVFFLANDSSVPVSQLSPHCGYSVVTSWRDLSLMAQYDACQVIQEDGSYVLPLLWRGAPVKMSCPVPPFLPHAVGPSSLCCFPSGMTVKIPGQRVNEEHLVNVRGEWTPLVQLSEQCGYTLDQQGAEMVISAPFITCGITEKDGKYTLTLDVANKVFTLACPVTSSEELPVNHQPELTSPSHLTSGAPTPVLSSLEPFQWLPPYYLAPPYYPHPTFHHVYSHPDGHAPAMPSTAPIHNMDISPTPQSLFHPPDYRDYYPKHNTPNEPYGDFDHSPSTIDEEEEPTSKEFLNKNPESHDKVTAIYDYSEMQRSSPTGFPAQLGAPHAQPPHHDFSPYYHYYHHPKIPLPGFPLQQNIFGPIVAKEPSTTEHNLQFPLLPPEAQENEAVGKGYSDRFVSPIPRTHPQVFPAIPNHVNHAPPMYVAYPQQSYPYQYYYYFPPVARGEAKKLSPLPPDKPLKTNLPVDQSQTYTPVSPSPNKDNTEAYLDESNAPVTHVKEEFTPLLSEDHEKKEELKESMTRPSPRSFPSATHPVAVPLPDRHYTPNQSLNYTSYPYRHHPYYEYYQAHYGPEGWLSAYNNMHPVPVKSTEPHFQVSSFPANPHMPLTPPYSNPNGAINPYYYYYYLYYQPEVSKGHRQVQPSRQMNSKTSDSPLSSKSKYNSMEMVVQKTADPHILHPMPNPLNSIYSRYTSQQHARHPVGLTAAGEKPQNNARKDYAKTNVHSTSRCGFGSEPDPDCLNSKDCCSHTIKDCTLGQYFVFAVPYSMVGPRVVPTVRSSDGRNMSCTLRRLNSDLDIYIVPLDGCGVNKHMFGQTVLHLLDLQGVYPNHGGNAPVRFTVGCSSSIGSPGEVMFHVMDQPSLPSAASVRLRIATDDTFSRYHSEAHLPFSHIRSRPLYVEVSLPDPQEPGLALLLHSCLAYTQNMYASSVLVYDGCQNLSISQLLPSEKSYVKKLRISSYLPPPPESFQHVVKGGHGSLEDPEVSFLTQQSLKFHKM
uniref:Uncharacterized LOC114468372 n=1 Tax=Gouania willdenowi TaxID=441366 RepID=A0A8C5DR81_GOUWI